MHVYVITSSPKGPCKIGVAIDPKRRLRELQTGSPSPLTLHSVEPIGECAGAVESAVHRALSARRSGGGSEWFDVTPQMAEAAIRNAAASAGVLIDDSSTLRHLEQNAVLGWLSAQSRLEDQALEADEDVITADDLGVKQPTRPIELLAQSLCTPPSGQFDFNDYLLTWEEGAWLRWAFERLGKRLPSGRRFAPYLIADDFLEQKGSVNGRDVAFRWIEWSTGRELCPEELRQFVTIWNKFAPLHNLIERKGPQWITAGIDDRVDDVHLFVLNGDRRRGDRESIVFLHDKFRAVLIPNRQIRLYHVDMTMNLEVWPLNGVAVSGFVTAAMPDDIWERPFRLWLRDAAEQRDLTVECFLGKSDHRFPEQREYDGPQPATNVVVDLPCIDEDGTY